MPLHFFRAGTEGTPHVSIVKPHEKVSWEHIGDEPWLLHNRLPDLARRRPRRRKSARSTRRFFPNARYSYSMTGSSTGRSNETLISCACTMTRRATCLFLRVFSGNPSVPCHGHMLRSSSDPPIAQAWLEEATAGCETFPRALHRSPVPGDGTLGQCRKRP